MASFATMEAISTSERRGVSTPEQGIQLHPAKTARVGPSDALPPTAGEANLQAVIDATFDGTDSGAACWLDSELLHQAFARQQTGRFTPIR